MKKRKQKKKDELNRMKKKKERALAIVNSDKQGSSKVDQVDVG